MLVRGLVVLATVLVFGMVVFTACEESSAAIQGIVMVGVGGQPDTTDPNPGIDRGSTRWCLWDSTHTVSPTFAPAVLDFGSERPDDDIDLLVSSSLTGINAVDLGEIRRIVGTFDIAKDNLRDVQETDLQLLVNYFCATTSYDSAAVHNFALFPSCADSGVGGGERDHVDFYLALSGVDATYGSCVSDFTSISEDEPPLPGYGEYHQNSFHVLVGALNASGDTLDWPVDAAVGAAHETQHAFWNSDASEHGIVQEHANFNEFFASGAAMMAKPRGSGAVAYDKPYAQSLVGILSAEWMSCGLLSNVLSVEPCVTYNWTDEEDCRTGYVNWAAWSTYLVERFAEASYEDDLLYRWLRSRRDSDGKYMRDMCGLASVLDSTAYAGLGGVGEAYPGGYRLQKIFHDYSIAKWVADDSHDAAYAFSDSISPSASLGLFLKNDTGQGAHNCYEIAIPPMFLADGDNDSTWVSVPGSGSDPAAGCTDGWNDPRDTTYCDNEYCDPVKVRLWGSYYISFVADTEYYDTSKSDRYLQVKVNWDEQAMSDSTELWVSLLEYSEADTNVYEIGESLTHVVTGQFAAGDSVVANIFDFCEGGNESVTMVLSLVPTVFDTFRVVCGGNENVLFNCMPRVVYDHDLGARQDLSFRYSFAVLQKESGGGCPFVSVASGGKYVSDNNVLAGATLGEDKTDLCVLSTPPSIEDGECRLRISEDRNDVSYFDGLRLYTTDVPSGYSLGMTVDGSPVTYGSRVSPGTCTDEDGRDVLDLILHDDGKTVLIPAGGWIVAEFDAPGRAGGGIGTDGGPGQKIDPPAGGFNLPAEQGLIDMTRFCYRENACTRFLDVPEDAIEGDGSIVVRLWTPVDFYVDQLFFSTHVPVAEDLEECVLIAAEHSINGRVNTVIGSVDGDYTSLSSGERMDLTFLPPAQAPRTERYYLLESTGRYEHVDQASPLGDGAHHPASVSVEAYPNPTTSHSTLQFTVPSPGGLTSVKVYNLAGRVVRDLGTEELPPGTYEVTWDGKDSRGGTVAAGVYFVRVVAPQGSEARKMVVLR